MRVKLLRVAVALAVVGAAGSACAQQAPVTTFTSMMNSIIRSTPGITNVPITSGVRVAASGTVPVAVSGGLTIPVATTVAADASAATVAAGLGRLALRAVPWIGTGLAVAAIAEALSPGGMHTCPAPDFFCKTIPGSSGLQPPKISYHITHSTGADSGVGFTVAGVCAAYVTSRNNTADSISNHYVFSVVGSSEEPNPWCHYKGIQTTTGYTVVDYTASASDLQRTQLCPDGTDPRQTGVYDGGQYYCRVSSPPQDVPATETDVNKTLTDRANADHDWLIKMKAQMDQVAQQNTDLEPPINWKGVPITVTAPPVSGPETQVSTRQVPNADGTTSTETVKTQTTVTPSITPGGTVDNPGVTYPSKTVTTTTTINNTTNVKNETTNVTNNAPVPEKQELPTDYAREATLKAVLTNLTTEYTGEKPKGDDELKSIDNQNKTGAAAVDQVTEGSTGLKGWLPSIKTSTCRNPKVPQPLTGALVDVPICDTVDVFASLISAVIAVFALYGSVREVQAAMKA